MKTFKPKARRMWANYYPDFPTMTAVHETRARALGGSSGAVTPVPVAVIPLDDPEALILKARDAYVSHGVAYSQVQMHAALIAIGVLPKQRKGRK